MGTYATTTSLQTVLIGVTFDTATTSLATQCISWAETEINKYLIKRYDITTFLATTTAVPPLVRTWAEQLAEGYFWQRNSRGSKESLTRGNEIVKDVKSNLKDVAEYKGHIFNTTGSLIEDKSTTAYRVKSTTEDYSDTFNEDDTLDWAVSTDKVSDIADDRN
jgi:1,2-phenylacetyl-CoA epoxidase catalytic subunit